jgi:eukaryotic-like serine/threonine-protein kinase
MKNIKLFLLVALFLTSCAPPLTPTPTQTLTPEPPTSAPTLTPEPPTFTPTPTPGIGSTWTSPKDGMVMVYIPEGNFQMGSNHANEKPVHTVYLDAFWIDQTVVTNAMYSKCVASNACEPPAGGGSSDDHPSYYGNSQFDNYPVVDVTWDMAGTYCKWAGRQLPTEAQWEKAARGTDGRIYPWGNIAPNASLYYVNYDRKIGDTTEVGIYPKAASVYGMLDAVGNVFQWVADWYSETYFRSSPASNPLGPDSGQYRVVRSSQGGSGTTGARVTNRTWFSMQPWTIIGFRCARSQ